jgi:hypothetical protein
MFVRPIAQESVEERRMFDGIPCRERNDDYREQKIKDGALVTETEFTQKPFQKNYEHNIDSQKPPWERLHEKE